MDGFMTDRRALLAKIGLLIGASALPIEALAAPARKGAAKRFLSPAQFQLLSAIVDTLIPATDTPGAVATGVPKQIDALLLNWASAERRVELNKAMAAIDKLALSNVKMGFTALTPAKRKELLLGYDKEAVKPDPKPSKPLTGLAALLGGGSAPINPGYVKLKELVIALYYNSEAAMTKELVYEHVPGAFIASLPVTAKTRPFAGVGGLG